MIKEKKVNLYYKINSCSECIYFSSLKGIMSCELESFSEKRYNKFNGSTIHPKCKLDNFLKIIRNKDIKKIAKLKGIQVQDEENNKRNYVNLNNIYKVSKIEINSKYNKGEKAIFNKNKNQYLDPIKDSDDCLYCIFHYTDIDNQYCKCMKNKTALHKVNCSNITMNSIKACLSFERIEERTAKDEGKYERKIENA